jgi:fibronectin-binding autotransporter adhesin
MSTGWWHNAASPGTGLWTATTQWYTTAPGTTAVGAVPNSVTLDTANFNANGFAGPYNVYMNGNKAVLSVSINGTATGGLTIIGGISGTLANNLLTLGSSGIVVAAGAGAVTLGVSAGLGAVNLTSAGSYPVVNASSNTLTIWNSATINAGFLSSGANSTGNLDWRGQITGAGGFSVSGTGTGATIVRGSNNYAGNTNIGPGLVQIALASALSTTSIVMFDGGKLSSLDATQYALSNALFLNANVTLGASGTGVLTFSGTTTLSTTTTLTLGSAVVFSGALNGPSLNLTIAGAELRFTSTAATGTFNGVFTTSGSLTTIGAYSSGTPNQIANASRVVITGGQFLIAGGNAYTFATPVIGSTGVFYVRNTNASGITFTGDPSALTPNGFTGTFQLYADASESVATSQLATFTLASQVRFSALLFSTFTGANSTLRQTWKYTGTSAITSTATVGVGPYTTGLTGVIDNSSSNGSAVSFSGAVQLGGSGQNGTLETAATSGNITLSGDITETTAFALSFVKSGPNAVTLTGANTYKGSVTINNGTLNANSATALGVSSSTTDIAVTSSVAGATLSLGVAATYASRSVALTGALVIAHSVASTTSTFLGITTPSAASAYIRATASGSLAAPITNTNGVTLGAASGVTLTLATGISGSSSLTLGFSGSDTGTVVLAAASASHTGSVSLNYGTLSVTNALSLGSSSAAHALTISDSTTLSIDVAPTSSLSTSVRGTGVSSNGAIIVNNTGTSSLGAITLAANAYVRGTATGTLSSTFTLGSNTLTAGAASGNTLYLTGAISGLGGLTLGLSGDTGTVALTTSNSYSGNTTLSFGTLTIGNNTALGSGTLSIAAGTTLNASATLTNVTNPITVNGSFTFTGSNSLTQTTGAISIAAPATVTVSANTLSLGGAVAFSNALTKAGASGTLTLTGTNTGAGGVVLSAGTLSIGNNAALGTGKFTWSGGTLSNTTGFFTIDNAMDLSGTLTWAFTSGNFTQQTGAVTLLGTTTFSGSTNTLIINGNIGDGGNVYGITRNGGIQALQLGGTNTYTGAVTVTTGTIRAYSATALGAASASTDITVASGATLEFYAGGSATYTARSTKISGTGLAGAALNINGSSITTTLSVSLQADSAIAVSSFCTLAGTIDTTATAYALTAFTITSSLGTISAVISGGGSLTTGISGFTGTTALTGSNTFTGSVFVSYGLTSVTNVNGLGANTARAITVANGAALSIGAAVSNSSFSTSIVGTGITTNGAVIIAAAVTANLGTITLVSASSIRATASGTLAGTITCPGAVPLTLQGAPGVTGTFSAVIGGSLSLIAGGTANGTSQTGTVTLSSTVNSYTGDTTVSTGTMSVTGRLGSGTYAGAISVASGATISFGTLTQTLNGNITGAGNLTKGTGPLTIGATFGITGTFTAPNTTIFNTAQTVSAASVALSSSTIQLPNNTLLTLDGVVSGATLTLGATATTAGAGSVLKLTNTGNSFTGTTTVRNGALYITDARQLGNQTKALTLIVTTTGASALVLDGSAGSISLPSTITLSMASLANVSPAPTYYGLVSIGGNNTVAGIITLGSTVSDAYFTVTAGTLTLSGDITASAASKTAIFGGTATGTCSGVIRNTNTPLVKVTGSATWTFTGTNLYTSGTTIESSAKAIAGNTQAFGLGSVTLSAATATIQTLTGSGPSAQNGKLTITGNFDNSAGGTIRIGG